MSNLGYLRGINGKLTQHLRHLNRHVYCPVDIQKMALQQLTHILEKEDPDVCCFLEIDKGSSDSANFNQFEAILSDKYPYSAIENKYGAQSRLSKAARSRGKSSAFMVKHEVSHEKIYFTHGTKRLIYKIVLPVNITVFFTHFSLKRKVREKQFQEIRTVLDNTEGDVILMGDFNVWTGLNELEPLMRGGGLQLINKEDEPTFTFHRYRKVLDLCICSERLASRLDLRVIPQPFSDHDALLVGVKH